MNGDLINNRSSLRDKKEEDARNFGVVPGRVPKELIGYVLSGDIVEKQCKAVDRALSIAKVYSRGQAYASKN
jgi:hypothetical protein